MGVGFWVFVGLLLHEGEPKVNNVVEFCLFRLDFFLLLEWLFTIER